MRFMLSRGAACCRYDRSLLGAARVAKSRDLGYGWSASLGLGVIIWVVLPFVISQLCAAVVLWRIHRRTRQVDAPEKQEAVAKR